MTRTIRSWLDSLFDLLATFPAEVLTLGGPLGDPPTCWLSLDRVLEQARDSNIGELG